MYANYRVCYTDRKDQKIIFPISLPKKYLPILRKIDILEAFEYVHRNNQNLSVFRKYSLYIIIPEINRKYTKLIEVNVTAFIEKHKPKFIQFISYKSSFSSLMQFTYECIFAK